MVTYRSEIKTSPKLLLSCCWSTLTHEGRVLNLAANLRAAGVDVILDKWDLTDGEDSQSFLRQTLANPQIKKVVMITDADYLKQSLGQPIDTVVTAQLYQQHTIDKFLVVSFEQNSQGKPFLPDFYKSRHFIDLSEPQWYKDGLNKLLRWVYDKPLYLKPELGQRPSFLTEESGLVWTSASYKRAIKAIVSGLNLMAGPLDEYLEVLFQNLKQISLSQIDVTDTRKEFQNSIARKTNTSSESSSEQGLLDAIEQFLPLRNQYLNVISTICHHQVLATNIRKIHRFFEQLISLIEPATHLQNSDTDELDHFKFIIHELFLYTVAILLRYEAFEQLNYLLSQPYDIVSTDLAPYSPYAPVVNSVRFPIIFQFIASLERRNTRLKLRRLSLRTDLLHQRHQDSEFSFRELMQADFLLFIRAEIEAGNQYSQWWPETLLLAGSGHEAFEIFARARSKAYFQRVQALLGIRSRQELEQLLWSYTRGNRRLPHWQSHSFDPYLLAGFQQLATHP